MTLIFWISICWVLAATAVGRTPIEKRFLPGAALMNTALPIVFLIGLTVGWLMALLAMVAVGSTFPAIYRILQARYRGEKVELTPNVLRLMVVPGEI